LGELFQVRMLGQIAHQNLLPLFARNFGGCTQNGCRDGLVYVIILFERLSMSSATLGFACS
jgi:hypothetical protein